MWIIELNIAGLRYTREMPDLRRRRFRLTPRNTHWTSAGHAPEPSHAA